MAETSQFCQRLYSGFLSQHLAAGNIFHLKQVGGPEGLLRGGKQILSLRSPSLTRASSTKHQKMSHSRALSWVSELITRLLSYSGRLGERYCWPGTTT